MCSLACLLARARARADASPLARLASARAKVCSLLVQAAFGILVGFVGLGGLGFQIFRHFGVSGFSDLQASRFSGFQVLGKISFET